MENVWFIEILRFPHEWSNQCDINRELNARERGNSDSHTMTKKYNGYFQRLSNLNPHCTGKIKVIRAQHANEKEWTRCPNETCCCNLLNVAVFVLQRCNWIVLSCWWDCKKEKKRTNEQTTIPFWNLNQAIWTEFEQHEGF